MQRERELRHPLVQLRPEPLGVGFVLETGDDVVGIAHEDDISPGVAFAPLLRPEIEDVMQVDVRQIASLPASSAIIGLAGAAYAGATLFTRIRATA